MKILRLYKLFSSIIVDLSASLARSTPLACVCNFYTMKQHPFLYDGSLDGYVILVLHAKNIQHVSGQEKVRKAIQLKLLLTIFWDSFPGKHIDLFGCRSSRVSGLGRADRLITNGKLNRQPIRGRVGQALPEKMWDL